MSHYAGAALASAEAQVAAARDDPAARLALVVQTYHGPTGRAPRHLPFRRAALSFMRWQANRGVLDSLDASPPGSVWWRAVNERRCGTDAKPSHSSAAWRESRRLSPCGCGWSSSRDRRGRTGTELTTRASWLPTWSTATSPKQRARRSASSWTSRWSACSQTAIRLPSTWSAISPTSSVLAGSWNYAVIVPRLQRLYEWSAGEL